MANCTRCDGSGVCPKCNGEGEIKFKRDADLVLDAVTLGMMGGYGTEECPTCSGTGNCPRCEGSGEIE